MDIFQKLIFKYEKNLFTIFLLLATSLLSTHSSQELKKMQFPARNSNENAKYDARQVIVVAGNFSLDGEIVNIAQYEISTGL